MYWVAAAARREALRASLSNVAPAGGLALAARRVCVCARVSEVQDVGALANLAPEALTKEVDDIGMVVAYQMLTTMPTPKDAGVSSNAAGVS